MPSSNVFVSGRVLDIKSFYMSDHEVTRAEYKEVMRILPDDMAKAHDKDGHELTGDAAGKIPVNRVSWYDALVYCNKRSIKEKLTPCYTIGGKTNPLTSGAQFRVQKTVHGTPQCAILRQTATGFRQRLNGNGLPAAERTTPTPEATTIMKWHGVVKTRTTQERGT